MKPAIFLDRDGVITEETGRATTPDNVRILPFAKLAVSIIHEKGYYAIIVSNQSGVAKGLFPEASLQLLNNEIEQKLGIDKVYYCPHYEGGIISQYSIKCNCRKPNIGMIEMACRDFDIDMSKSWIVGDRESDIITGIRANIHTCLVNSVYSRKALLSPNKPEINLENILEFANMLIPVC